MYLYLIGGDAGEGYGLVCEGIAGSIERKASEVHNLHII